MSVISSCAMAVACFSRIPMPNLSWERERMRYLLAALPVVGVLAAALTGVWVRLSVQAGFSTLFRAVVLTLLPVALTGAIHLDGFCDTVDARATHADPARRSQVMADPHVGAFAVIALVCWALASLGCAFELDVAHLWAWCATFVWSRCITGLAALTWPARPGKGMLRTLRDAADLRTSTTALVATLLLTSSLLLWKDPVVAAAALVAGGLSAAWVRRLSTREFEGMSGDLSGYLLVLSELAMQAVIACAGRVVAP